MSLQLAPYHKKKKYASRRRGSTRSSMVIPGYTRQSGYYGRYNGINRQSGFRELKFFDHPDSRSMPDSWSQTNLNKIPQGVGQSERIGRKVTIKSLYVHWLCTKPSTTDPGLTDDAFALVIVLDKQCNGSVPSASSVFSALPGTPGVNQFMNLENSNRFRILHRVNMNLTSMAGANAFAASGTGNHTYGSVSKIGHISLKNLTIPILFDADESTGEISTIRSNNIIFFYTSESGLVDIEFTSRLRYTDM